MRKLLNIVRRLLTRDMLPPVDPYIRVDDQGRVHVNPRKYAKALREWKGLCALFALALSASAQTFTDSATIRVKVGETFQFHTSGCVGCTIELAPGHDSTSGVTSGGLYTAPSTAKRHGRLGGCPIMPHNSIYNLRVDAATSSLPTLSTSAAMVSAMMTAANASAYKGFHASGGGPANEITNAAPLVTFAGDRLSAQHWNGSYRFATPGIIPYGSRTSPLAETQSGWRSSFGDNRYMGISRDSCEVFEVYLPYGTDLTTLSEPVSFGGASFYHTLERLNGDGLKGAGSQGSTAGGTWLAALQVKASELARVADTDGASGDLGHAIAITLPNTAISPATCCGGAGHVWPATANSYAGTGNVPYGTCFRLDPAFVNGYDPSVDSAKPRVQAMVKVLLNTLTRRCSLVMDGTYPFDSFGFHMLSESGVDEDVQAALTILSKSPNLASNWTTTGYSASKSVIANLQAVDLTSIKVSDLSNMVYAPFAGPERVLLKDASGTVVDSRDVVVIPPTVGSLENQVNVFAGATVALAPKVWTSGLANPSGLTWSIVSGSGSISSSGVFTPAAVTTPAITKVRVSATEDSSASFDFRVISLPAVGTKACLKLANTANTTAGGCTWWGRDGSGNALVIGGDSSTDYNIYAGTAPDGTYPAIGYQAGSIGDQNILFHLPPGSYNITTLGFTGSAYGGGLCTGDEFCTPTHLTQIELQNTVAMSPTLWYSLAGGYWKGAHVTRTATVGNDGKLSYSIRKVGPGSIYPYISSLVIEPVASADPAPIAGAAAIITGSVSIGGSTSIQH